MFKWIERAAARRYPTKTREQIRTEVKEHQDRIGHSVAKRFSRGNVNIKQGELVTREDLDAMRRE